MREMIDKYFMAKNIKKIAIYGNNNEKKQMIDLIEKSTDISIVDISDAEIVVVTDDINYLEIEKEISEKFLVEIISLKEMIDKIYANKKYIISEG